MKAGKAFVKDPRGANASPEISRVARPAGAGADLGGTGRRRFNFLCSAQKYPLTPRMIAHTFIIAAMQHFAPEKSLPGFTSANLWTGDGEEKH
ncbi:hypothetical protein [Azospirillum rugosum]|uniref:Uncharacterized protein n=1 Tax=Azospirillum rugosum TaxID=416170 RepID=A0ABS4SND5_9PROT|nr:hypothetical protein [Azospirillum rugosum]MBP2294065.1 hypothetical protein [Azospirillum rugosum]MDQ0527546.1 hypothetical protein [Azospirillum rugosum]